MKTVNKPFRKKDAMQLVTGQPVYMDDIIPQDCLIVKLLRSPHANAIVRSINTAVAKKVPGIEAIFTWEDVPQDARRYTQAGQTYPEASPYDRLLIDRHVRFVGDVVAIVAGKDEKCVDKALKLIKVDYEVLEAVLDFHTAKDNPILVHPEDNWESLAPVGADNKRNLCAHDACGSGDIDAVLAGCDVVIDHVYHTKACQQAMMETFRTYCSIDTYGRLNVLSSTQIVFHARRNIANALHIPKSMVRVSKPRIGGGFGAKQTAVSEVYPAFVTWMTKKPSKLIFSRVESQTASSPRHEMEMHVRLGATRDGIVKGIDLYTLSNTGAYGEHGPTTVGLSGHKSIPLYGKAEAFRFVSDVVYTNHMSAGAYRGYGATQGLFAVESAVNELAAKLHMDPFKIREMNIVREGDVGTSGEPGNAVPGAVQSQQPKPQKAAPEDLQKIVAGWRAIVGQTTGLFKQSLQRAVPKYNGETGDPILYVEFQDFLGMNYVDNPEAQKELQDIIAARTGKSVEIHMLVANKHQHTNLAQITVDDALRENIHMDIVVEEDPDDES